LSCLLEWVKLKTPNSATIQYGPASFVRSLDWTNETKRYKKKCALKPHSVNAAGVAAGSIPCSTKNDDVPSSIY